MYKEIATINEAHKVYLVENHNQVYVKKILEVYNLSVYDYLYKHPMEGIPRIIEYEEDNHQLIVIEEYIQGSTLEDYIDQQRLNEDIVKQIMLQLCTILNQIHSIKPPIVHRDIKPSNIIVQNDKVFLLDFNAAKIETSKGSDTRLIGTQGYAAPEQYGFASSTNQTDIYALGILLKEMVSSFTDPVHVFDSIIDKCTQMDPKNRFESVLELKKAINYPSIQILPPGFRTKTPWKMFLASFAYLLIITVTVLADNSIEDVKLTGFHDLLYRIAIFLIGIIFVCIPCNYMNIQKCMPLCRSKNPIIKAVGILLLLILCLLALLFVCSLIESFLYPTL